MRQQNNSWHYNKALCYESAADFVWNENCKLRINQVLNSFMKYFLNIYLLLLLSVFTNVAYAQEQGCTTGDCENGKGRYIFPNGDKYIGEFKHAKLDGRGVYTSKNGNVYKGQFKDNMRHGYGTYKWLNGDSYIGEYVNNERQGEGTYYGIDGTVNEGYWENGNFVKAKESPEVDTISSSISGTDPFSKADTINIHKLFAKKFPALKNIQEGQKRNALVIGNSSYLKNPLKNPVNDAIAIAEELQRSGFNVYIYTNVSQKDLKIAIRDFGQILKDEGGVGLFYFAGHGLQEGGRNYILPVDADIRKSKDIELESVDLSRVLVEMDYAENDLNLIILDACRDNPYKEEFKDSRNQHNGLASIQSAPYNSFIAFSTSPGAVAADNPNSEHGLYTQELLAAMRNKGAKLEDVFKKVRANVRRQSNGTQIPWEISSVEVDFYFKD
jgi:hypothetical protein